MACLVACLWLGPVPARADLEVSASVSIHAHSDFYEPLTPHGAWIEVGSYGRCWRPAVATVEWQPYCDGHWEWTDCGWYWVSDEPWAWACYHYGSWVYHPRHAWVWVPGIEWAPAWVSWRVGGGYVGWAPLPPPHLRIAPTFVFVETRRFRERIRPTTVVVNNTTIINKTTVISNVRREERSIGGGKPQKVVINEGPGLEPIRKATGEPVRAVPIQEAVRRTAVPPSVERRSREGKVKGQQQPQPGTEKPALTPERKAPPAAVPEPPKPGAPGKSVQPGQPGKPDQPDKIERGNPPGRDDVGPPRREQPPLPPGPPGRPGRKPPKGQDGPGEGRGHGKDRN